MDFSSFSPSAFLTALIAVSLLILLVVYALWRKRERETAALFAEQESKIETLEFKNKLLVEAQEIILFVLDADQNVRMSNKIAKRFFRRKHLLQNHYLDFIPYQEVLSVIGEALQEKQPLKEQVTITHLDHPDYLENEERFYTVKVDFFEDVNETPFTRIQLSDITDAYRTEQIRKDFVANASHELRTPLAIINGYLETLLEPGVLDDRETSFRFLKVLKKHGKRLNRIVEEMLIISRLESGVVNVLRPKPFRVLDCINDCLERLESLTAENQTEIRMKLSDPDFTILADRFYWTQILFNLIENALKQNPERPLTIKIGCSEKRKKGTIVISVSDNGVGIPAQDLPFIFGRFFRVEKHHSQSEIKGTGLGLSIVKRAVEAHGGTITCKSRPNQLTKFEITLPQSLRVEPSVAN